jgi:GNAT superfamily N-acetyltransferase
VPAGNIFRSNGEPVTAGGSVHPIIAGRRPVADRLRNAVTVPYDSCMRDGCLRIFDLNVPAFFAGKERVLFEEYLDGHSGSYLAIVFEGGIAACGGFFVLPEERIAGLSWGMVRPDCQHMGVGRRLLLTRLLAVTARSRVDRVILDTSQNAQGFFGHFGFVQTRTTPDGLAPGLDRVEMTLPVDTRARRNLVRRCNRLGLEAPAGFELPSAAGRPGR